MMKVVALSLLVLGATALPAAGPDVACPPSFKQATGPCDPRVGPATCSYPEGRCECVRSVPCSGVLQPAGEPRWKCQAKRTDGCPDNQPAQGAACSKPGKKCSYGDCGGMELTCDAKTRKWTVTGIVAPPPSAPGPGPGPQPKPTPVVAEWKTCPGHERFACLPVSRGIAPRPGEMIPMGCGCVPQCPPGRGVIITRQIEGTWPDGSQKGQFHCSSTGIP
jgi:hypothetical protein